MPLNDILLHIDSYPDVTPEVGIDDAIQFVANVQGKVTALAVQTTFPPVANRIADYVVGLSGIAREESAKSLAACRAAVELFKRKAHAAGVFRDAIVDSASYLALADHVAVRARTFDLCIVPVASAGDGQMEVAQGAIFSSGRPVLVLPVGDKRLAKAKLGKVVLAWDGSRQAARAMADAIPILLLADAVHILTVVNEKPTAVAGLGGAAQRHLSIHGVRAVVDEVEANDDAIGVVLDRYLKAQSIDLMVMGAYGQSRLREFILGGATQHVLRHRIVPLLLSH